MSTPLTVKTSDLGKAFFNATSYLNKIKDNEFITTDHDIRHRVDLAIKKWKKYFDIDIKVNHKTQAFTFTFKDKATYMLWMLEWA